MAGQLRRSTQLTVAQRDLISPSADPPVVRRLGTVTAVQAYAAGAAPTITATVMGASVTPIPCLGGYYPVVGDVVLLLAVGGDMVAVGVAGPAARTLQEKNTIGILGSTMAGDGVWHSIPTGGPSSITINKQADANHSVLSVDARVSGWVDASNNLVECGVLNSVTGIDTKLGQSFYNEPNSHRSWTVKGQLVGLAAGTYTLTLRARITGLVNFKMDANDWVSLTVAEVAPGF